MFLEGSAWYCFFGGMLGFWLIYRFITLGSVGRYPSTILSALLNGRIANGFFRSLLADIKR